MTITICPAALQGTGKCRNAHCHLRHDVVHCKPCKCFILHRELAAHRRREDHRIKCGFGTWKTDARRPARVIHPLTTPYAPKLPKVPKLPKPSKKRPRKKARKERLAGICGVSVAGGEAEAQHLSASGEEGLDFKSEVGISITKKEDRTIPVVIQKIADKNVSLTLVDVVVTGAGSRWFRATPSPPKKIKWKTPRKIRVSFVPTAPGEWYAQLTLRFLHVSS